jgi:excisionase family DNA binding protein
MDEISGTQVGTSPGTHNGVPQGLSVQEAALHLGVSINTIRRMIKDGRLRSEKVTTSSGFAYLVYPDSLPTGNHQDTAHEYPSPEQPGTQLETMRAEAMATYSAKLIAPLVAELGQAREQIATLARENGERAERIRQLESQLTAPGARPSWWQTVLSWCGYSPG